MGSVLAKNLVGYCGGVKEVFTKSKSFLKKALGIGEHIASNITGFRDFGRAEEEADFISINNISYQFFLDKEYPFRLKNIPDCLIMIYKRGNADLSPERCIAIVGSRKVTEYGRSFISSFIEDLVPYSPTIISGLAYGVDVCAHKQSLKNRMSTVGVLAHGLERIYPEVHTNVARDMVNSNGAILTEYLSGTKPNRENFPMRNRIVAGMVDAVIVVESAAKGGSLITAELANQYNRDILAVPSDYGKKYSAGCNYLIKSHKAHLLENAEDLFKLLNWDLVSKKTNQKSLFIELSENEQKVIDVFDKSKEVGVDTLISSCGLSRSELAVALLELEMKNCIISHPGKRYQSVL